MGGIHFVTAVSGARGDNPDRGRLLLHGADLHTRSMGPQQAAIGQIKSVLLVACRMIGRRIECVEAMPLGLDVRPLGQGKSHPPENFHRPPLQMLQGMQTSDRPRHTGQRWVDLRHLRFLGRGGKLRPAHLERTGDRGADFMEKLADFRTLFLGQMPHLLSGPSEPARTPRDRHPDQFERRRVRRTRDIAERLLAQGDQFLTHGVPIVAAAVFAARAWRRDGRSCRLYNRIRPLSGPPHPWPRFVGTRPRRLRPDQPAFCG